MKMIDKYRLTHVSTLEDGEKLYQLATEAHNSGYQIEAFSVLLECIRFNLIQLFIIKTGKKPTRKNDQYERYKEICRNLSSKKLIEKKTATEIIRFYNYRRRVVHEMIMEQKVTSNNIKQWFEYGKRLNLFIQELVKSASVI